MSHEELCIICIMMNVTWQRFDQSANQLIVDHTTKAFITSCRTGWFLFTFSCPLALTDVNFRMASRFLPRKKLKSHGTMSRGKMVMVVGSYLCAHIQAVGIDLDTRKARCNTSVQNMAEYTAVISSWLTSVALRTVDALSTAGLLWQSTRNTHTDLSLCRMTILPNHCVDASYCTFHRVWTLLIWIGFCCMTVHLCILVHWMINLDAHRL